MTTLNFKPARQQDLAEAIERYVERHSLAEAINILAEIAWQKAERIEANWQDQTLAKAWRREGKRLNNCAGDCQT